MKLGRISVCTLTSLVGIALIVGGCESQKQQWSPVSSKELIRIDPVWGNGRIFVLSPRASNNLVMMMNAAGENPSSLVKVTSGNAWGPEPHAYLFAGSRRFALHSSLLREDDVKGRSVFLVLTNATISKIGAITVPSSEAEAIEYVKQIDDCLSQN